MICDPNCGLCCSKIPAWFLKSQNLPVHERGVGCANLGKDNRCTIYETRPEVCRVTDEAVARKGCDLLQKMFNYVKEPNVKA